MGEKLRSRSNQGFTFTEVLFVVIVIGILSAIIAPTGLGFVGRQQLRTATNQIYWAMQNARSQARAERSSYQASFKKDNNNLLQYAVHSTNVMPVDIIVWEPLPHGVQVDPEQTSLLKVNPNTNKVKNSETGYYRVIFNYKGCPVYWATDECTQTSLRAKGRITLKHQFLGERRRCVIVSTLIGLLRMTEDVSENNSNGERCYRD